MTREELIRQIFDLHGRVKKTEHGERFIDEEHLGVKLGTMNYDTLATVKRFYEALLESE